MMRRIETYFWLDYMADDGTTINLVKEVWCA